MTWPELQNMFKHQYSKIGNSREQLFHAQRSFHYDENVETPDAYVIRIKQVARLLGYEDLQVLEVFKNTVPNRLYCLVEVWYSLEQYIGLKEVQRFHPLLWTSSGLKGTWKLSTYIGLVSLRCAKTVITC